MFENIEDTQVKVEKEGRQWKEVVFPTHDAALKGKKSVFLKDGIFFSLSEDDFDFKIKKLSDGFHLKIREKQSSIDRKKKIEENQQKLMAEQKEEKKQKKQLNKKQRD